MLFDQNYDPTFVSTEMANPDWPFAAPARAPVREEVVIKGSSTGGRRLEVQGTSDAYEPPDLSIPPNS